MFVCISNYLYVMRLRLPRRWWGRHQLYLMRNELLRRQIYLMRTEWLGTPHDLAWVCVCVCVFVCVFVCVRASRFIQIHSVYTYVYICTYIHMYSMHRVYICIYICTYIHMYTYAHICIMSLNKFARTTHDLAYVCACAYLCMYISLSLCT